MITERLIADNLSKKFKIDQKTKRSFLSYLLGLNKLRRSNFLEAVDKVSLIAKPGEFIALIGKNGSGKSTLLRTVAGIYLKDGGTVNNRGKIVPLINLEVGLKLRLTMADNIFLCGALFGLTKKEIEKKFDDIVKFSELEQFVATKLYKFSQGMEERLAFSIAINCNPEILLLDELFNVADEDFKNKAGKKLKTIVQAGATIIFVSHNLELIRQYADKVIWLENGRIKQEGSEVDKIITAYSNS